MSGSAFGQIFGIPMGIVLAGRMGFKAPFLMFAVAMFLAFFLILLKVPQPDVKLSEKRLSVGGAFADYMTMLRRPAIAYASFAFFLMFLGVSLYVVYFPTWLERHLGATPGAIATLFLVGGLANVLTGPQAGRISDRVGRKGIILLSCTGLFVAMLSTTVVIREFWMAYPVFFIVMVLVAMRISPFSALLTALVTDEKRGSLMSLTVALGQVGFAVGATLAGLLYDGTGYWSNTVLGAFSVLGMGLTVWYLVPEPRMDAGQVVAPAPAADV